MSEHLSQRPAPESGLGDPADPLALALQFAPMVVYTTQAGDERAVTYISPNFTHVTGRRAEQFTSLCDLISDLNDRQRSETFARVMEELLESRSARFDRRLVDDEGDVRWFRHTLRLCGPDAAGHRQIVGCMVDVTQEKRLDRTLHEVIEGLPDAFSMVDQNGYTILCNRAYADLFGLSPNEMYTVAQRERSRRFLALVDEFDGRRFEDPDSAVDAWVARLWTTALYPLEVRLKTGEWKMVTTKPTSDGRLVRLTIDITREKRAELALRESEERFRSIVEGHPLPVWLIDIETAEVLYQSPASARLMGREWPSDTPAYSSDHFVNPEIRDELNARLREAGELRDVECEFKRADGTRFWGSVNDRLIRYNGREASITSIVDLTERKKVEHALRESEALVRRVLEACPVPITMSRVNDGHILYESPATNALFGESPGTHFESTFAYHVDAAERDCYIAALRKRGAIDDCELRLRRRDGTSFWGSVSARLIDYQGEDVIVSSVEDLTERHALEAEMARQRKALFQSEKLGAMGELLAGVAHELNNPLSVVVGQALILEETLDDSDTLEAVELIARSAERCARIVKTFLAMARQRPAETVPVDLNRLVESAAEVTAYAMRSSEIDVALELEPRPAPALGDASQLSQVLTNLLVNAQHALEDHQGERRVVVRTRRDDVRREVLLEVRDTGPGMSDEVRARVFEPFFTTKKEGIGTGLGLALCHRIVEAHGGRIRLESAPGRGAAFHVRLPAAPKPEAPASAPAPAHAATPVSVLVVDDEPDVAEVIAAILQRDGHEVVTAHSGGQALTLLAERGFDVILSDLRMPDMDGPSLYQALAERDRALLERLAFVTGDTMSPKARAFLDTVGSPCLEKPVTPAMVRKLIRGLRRQ